jgi:ribosomal protein L37AE/L43A
MNIAQTVVDMILGETGEERKCPECDGTREIETGTGMYPCSCDSADAQCPECDGTGEIETGTGMYPCSCRGRKA